MPLSEPHISPYAERNRPPARTYSLSLPSSPIRPGKGDHAIEAVAIGIEWAPPLGARQLVDATSVHSTNGHVSAQLPGKKVVPGLKLELTAGMGSNPALAMRADAELTDFTHSRSDGAIDTTLSIRPDFFSCSSTEYRGWNTEKARLLALLLPFVHAVPDASIGAVGLQYVDVFRWNKSQGNLVAEVLNLHSGWLPAVVQRRKSFWHVHQGWFSEGPGDERILNQIEIDFQEESVDFALKISGQHRFQAMSFSTNTPSLGVARDEVEGALDHMHQINKVVLNDLLTPEMLTRIGLKPV